MGSSYVEVAELKKRVSDMSDEITHRKWQLRRQEIMAHQKAFEAAELQEKA